MITQKEFYRLYNRNSPDNKTRHIGSPDARLVLRDVSLPVAYTLARFGVSANAVTVSFLVISLVANTIILFPGAIVFLILIVLYEIAQMLDCVDGQLARYHGKFSPLGHLFDSMTHVLIAGSFEAAMGLRLYWATGNMLFPVLAAVTAYAGAFDVGWDKASKGTYRRPVSVFTRYASTFLDELRFFAGLLFLFTVLEQYLHFPFVSVLYIVHAAYIVWDKLLFRVLHTIRVSGQTETRQWHGWGKQ